MIYSKFDHFNCYRGEEHSKDIEKVSCKIMEDLICWSLELDDDLVLLKVNVKY